MCGQGGQNGRAEAGRAGSRHAPGVSPGCWGAHTGFGPRHEVLPSPSLPCSFSLAPARATLLLSRRLPVVAAIPTYEEAICYPLAEGPPTPPVDPMQESLKDSASWDALLRTQHAPQPPNYESITGAVHDISGETAPGTRGSCPGPAQTAGGGE